MSYIITKRTECDRCNGTGWANLDRCPKCDRKGFTETYHDFDEVLLSRLAKLRWNPRFTDNGTEWDEFDGMEIVNE